MDGVSNMLRFTVLALIATVSAVGAAQAVVAIDPVGRAPQAAAAAAPEVAAPTVLKAADGHYWAEALVDGRPVRFLVDTGSSAVALTLEDARALGFEPRALDYALTVRTAAGPVRAAAVRLASVSVGGAVVADVDALIFERGLENSLLGMAYLGRLSGFEASRTALVLQP